MKKLWSYIAALLAGMLIGIIVFFQMVKNIIGDTYQIKKPKLKGENNILEIKQTNKKDKKRRIKLKRNK